MAKKIDSNVTGLGIAYEDEIGQVTAPIFYPLEPNSYADMGADIKTVAREPITQSRQRKKGTTTDLDAAVGFNNDLTMSNMVRHLQGFFFADLRQKPATQPLNGATIPITGVTAASGYAAASGLGIFAAGNLVKATGFGLSANNGLKLLSAASAVAVMTTGLVDEAAPPNTGKLEKVGHQFAASDITFTLNGDLQRMNSTAKALAQLGLIPGEWVYVGGDSAGVTPANAKGYARVSVIASDFAYVEFDKIDWTPVADTAAGKTVRVYIGNVLRTEEDPALQVRRSGLIERTLGRDADGPQAEYVAGACFNTLTVNSPQADKITLDLGFIGIDSYTRTGAQGLLPGTRVTEVSEDAINTSQDFSRIKMSLVDETKSNVTPLFAYLMDLTLNISNNQEPNKALGILGAFEVSAGMFTADGQVTAYFSDVTAISAVRNNSDVTMDIVIAKNNMGQILDIPLMGLGGGKLTVEANKPITIPLDMSGAQSKFGHTLLYVHFPYLPNAAQ